MAANTHPVDAASAVPVADAVVDKVEVQVERLVEAAVACPRKEVVDKEVDTSVPAAASCLLPHHPGTLVAVDTVPVADAAKGTFAAVVKLDN